MIEFIGVFEGEEEGDKEEEVSEWYLKIGDFGGGGGILFESSWFNLSKSATSYGNELLCK